MSRVFAFEEGYLLLEGCDLKSKFFILFPLIASIFTVLLVDLMISLFNDSFGFDHMLVHFLLQILILLTILMFFVQNSLGMEEILGQFFTFSGKFFDDISQLLISELKLIDFISKNNFLLLVVIPIDSRHLSILLWGISQFMQLFLTTIKLPIQRVHLFFVFLTLKIELFLQNDVLLIFPILIFQFPLQFNSEILSLSIHHLQFMINRVVFILQICVYVFVVLSVQLIIVDKFSQSFIFIAKPHILCL